MKHSRFSSLKRFTVFTCLSVAALTGVSYPLAAQPWEVSPSLAAFSAPPVLGPKTKIVVEKLSNRRETWLLVSKKKYTLWVMGRDGKAQLAFRVGLGAKAGLERKVWAGDHGTPEGIYQITEVVGDHFPKDDPRAKTMRAMNTVFFSKKEGYHRWGYPDQDLGKNAYGPRFFRFSYPNDLDRARYERLVEQKQIPLDDTGSPVGIGSGLGIHGTNDPASLGHPASTGCIRMNNADVERLTDVVSVGTVLVILHE